MTSSINYIAPIWPHLATPATFVLFFTLPPFPLRRLLILATTAVLAYLCLFRPQPGPAMPLLLRFATSAIWLQYIGWLSRMLFHDPEQEFWRVSKPPHEAAAMGFGRDKLIWACSLLSSARGVGWNFQVADLPPPRPSLGRWRFVVRQLGIAAASYLFLDITTALLRRNHFQSVGDSVGELGLAMRVVLTAAIGLSIWCYSELQFALWSAVSVASGFSKEDSFPPLFGQLSMVHSLGSFWGRFWHQNLRQLMVDCGHATARLLHVPRRSKLSWLVHVWTAFLISGALHAIPSCALRPTLPFVNLRDEFLSVILFFVLQALGLTLEAVFLLSPGEDILLYEVGEKEVWFFGRMWTFCWLLYSGQFVLDYWLKTELGMLSVSCVPYHSTLRF